MKKKFWSSNFKRIFLLFLLLKIRFNIVFLFFVLNDTSFIYKDFQREL